MTNGCARVAAASQADPGAQKVLIAALKDKYYGLRIKAIRSLDMKNDNIRSAALPVLTTLAQTDDNTLARAAANESGRRVEFGVSGGDIDPADSTAEERIERSRPCGQRN